MGDEMCCITGITVDSSGDLALCSFPGSAW